MHEILTIQLGHRANHLATHFWNTQESYFTYDEITSNPSPVDHDIHFRPGLGPSGDQTFTPRTLIYDLKGGFGGLRKWGGLYDQQLSLDDLSNGRGGEKKIWEGNVVLQQDSQIGPSAYQKALDEGTSTNIQTLSTETVRYWSDFNRVFYHPRSIVQINDYELSSSLMPFEKFDSGEELFANIDREDDLLDRDLRPWAEECDQMQGIQIWASGDDAWGGFASRYAERLRDEFGKMSLWVWSAEEEKGKGTRAKQLLRATNAAKTLHEMAMFASMYVPLSVPTRLPQYVRLDRDSQWQKSAVLATAVETMTLPSRLRPSYARRGLLSDMQAALNVNGNQRIAQLHCSILDPETASAPKVTIRGSADHRATSRLRHSILAEDIAPNTDVTLDINLSSGEGLVSSTTNGPYQSQQHTFGAVHCLRGKPTEQRARNDEDAMDIEDNDNDIGQARERARFSGKPIVETYETALPFPILDSFPTTIFSPSYTHLLNNGSGGGGGGSGVAVHTLLATTSSTATQIRAMQKIVERTVTASDERESLSNGLGEIVEAYEEGWHDSAEDESAMTD